MKSKWWETEKSPPLLLFYYAALSLSKVFSLFTEVGIIAKQHMQKEIMALSSQVPLCKCVHLLLLRFLILVPPDQENRQRIYRKRKIRQPETKLDTSQPRLSWSQPARNRIMNFVCADLKATQAFFDWNREIAGLQDGWSQPWNGGWGRLIKSWVIAQKITELNQHDNQKRWSKRLFDLALLNCCF